MYPDYIDAKVKINNGMIRIIIIPRFDFERERLKEYMKDKPTMFKAVYDQMQDIDSNEVHESIRLIRYPYKAQTK